MSGFNISSASRDITDSLELNRVRSVARLGVAWLGLAEALSTSKRAVYCAPFFGGVSLEFPSPVYPVLRRSVAGVLFFFFFRRWGGFHREWWSVNATLDSERRASKLENLNGCLGIRDWGKGS